MSKERKIELGQELEVALVEARFLAKLSATIVAGLYASGDPYGEEEDRAIKIASRLWTNACKETFVEDVRRELWKLEKGE